MSERQTENLALSRAERAAKPAAERQLIMKNLFVGHDRFEEATRAIANFHMPVVGGVHDVGSLFVLAGDPRTGKSHVQERYARRFPVDTSGGNGVVRPVLYVDMPTDCGKRGMVEAIAAALNADYSPKMNIDALFGNVLIALGRQKVQLLILDEFQEAFDIARPAALKSCLSLLRKILNLRTLNVVAAGLMETYRLIETNPQLKGRGLLPHHIVMPYEWDNLEERNLFRLLCGAVDDRLPFNARSGLGSPWFASRLYWVTDGIIGGVKDFVFAAGCAAMNEIGAEKVEAKHFAEVWDRIRPVGMTYNPFREDISLAPPRRQPEAPKPALKPKDPARDAFLKS